LRAYKNRIKTEKTGYDSKGFKKVVEKQEKQEKQEGK